MLTLLVVKYIKTCCDNPSKSIHNSTEQNSKWFHIPDELVIIYLIIVVIIMLIDYVHRTYSTHKTVKNKKDLF